MNNRFEGLKLSLCDSIEWMDDHYDFATECWFDVIPVFGIDSSTIDDETWVNFYLDYYPETNEVKPVVHVDSEEGIKEVPFTFTKEEQKYMRNLINDYVRRTTSYTSLEDMYRSDLAEWRETA